MQLIAIFFIFQGVGRPTPNRYSPKSSLFSGFSGDVDAQHPPLDIALPSSQIPHVYLSTGQRDSWDPSPREHFLSNFSSTPRENLGNVASLVPGPSPRDQPFGTFGSFGINPSPRETFSNYGSSPRENTYSPRECFDLSPRESSVLLSGRSRPAASASSALDLLSEAVRLFQ